jgi:putative ABC transport system ATP-binding protein
MGLWNPTAVGGSARPVSSAALLEAVGIRKTYRLGETEVHALRGVSVSIAAGDFVAIMGASGSGKSTFMNILGCLDKPTAGQYLLEGIDVSGLPKRDLARIRNQKIGFVFQSFNLLGRTTALENTELPMLYSRVSKKTRETRAREALALVGLAEREHHFPSQLSGGQQQRVAIARALANRPSLLLADEPTGNLDSRTAVEIMEIFQRLNAKGLTIVLVTHETDIAQFTKRAIVFRDGHIKRDEAVASPQIAGEVLKNMPTIED